MQSKNQNKTVLKVMNMSTRSENHDREYIWDPGKVKAEIFENVCMSITKSVAKAVIRRRPRPRAQMCSQSMMLVTELECLQESRED